MSNWGTMVIDVYVVSNVHKSFDFHISHYVIDPFVFCQNSKPLYGWCFHK